MGDVRASGDLARVGSYILLVNYLKMGNTVSEQQKCLSDSLQQVYFFQSNQFLIHKATQQPCTLHRISTFSRQQSSAVLRNLTLYCQMHCRSISRLREYFTLDDSGYCSDQQKYYLVFDGHNSPNVKEEYFSRRYSAKGFAPEEIEAVLSCMLCGTRAYAEVFARKEGAVRLDSVCIDRRGGNSLWMKDPWLVDKDVDNSQLPVNFLASYPSPEKILASNHSHVDFNEFQSDLFSVGVTGLQLAAMNFRDDLYMHRKFVDRVRINQSLNSIQNGRLRTGLGILLSQDPNQRLKIFTYWDVHCSKQYRLASLEQNMLQISNTHSMANTNSELSQSQFSFMPTLQLAKRQPVYQHQHVAVMPAGLQRSQGQLLGTAQTGYNVNGFVQKVQQSPPSTDRTYQEPQSHRTFVGENKNQPKLTTQFNKPLMLKKSSSEAGLANTVFKKKVNMTYQPVQTRPPSNHQLHTGTTQYQHQQYSQQYPQQHPQQHPQQYPQISASKPAMNNSFRTPNFSYQTPQMNTNSLNSTSSHAQPGSYINSFHASTSQPHTHYNNTHGSIKQVAMTKSIVTPSQSYSIANKLSNQETNNSYSNGYSLRETKYISQGDKQVSIPLNASPGKPNRQPSYQIHDKPEPLHEGSPGNRPPQQMVALMHVQSPTLFNKTPQPSNQDTPTSPSTVPLTPPPAIRHPNKYNSTIVEVNEETPRESSDSELEPGGEIEFLVEEYETGSRYEGFKKNGLRHGKGKFYYQDGGYYDGEWKKNQMHGWGKLYYQGGQLAYEGNWAHDEFHGFGKVFNDNPVVLDGGFDYNNFDLLEDYWLYYQGMLANDTKEGRGRIQLTNKEVFQGDFHADRIQGFGKFLRKDGSVVEGIWRDSRLIKVLNGTDIYK